MVKIFVNLFYAILSVLVEQSKIFFLIRVEQEKIEEVYLRDFQYLISDKSQGHRKEIPWNRVNYDLKEANVF